MQQHGTFFKLKLKIKNSLPRKISYIFTLGKENYISGEGPT